MMFEIRELLEALNPVKVFDPSVVIRDTNTRTRDVNAQPAGLSNRLNDCFFNVIAQTLFAVPPLRRALLALKPVTPLPDTLPREKEKAMPVCTYLGVVRGGGLCWYLLLINVVVCCHVCLLVLVSLVLMM
jgi:hypothetical protein